MTSYICTWILPLLLCLVFPQDGLSVTLSGPVDYVVLQGEIEVTYSLKGSSNLTEPWVQLVELGNVNDTLVTAVPVPAQHPEGTLSFRCGVIDHAGTYVFRLLGSAQGPILKEAEQTKVTWPEFDLRLPVTHIALQDPVAAYFAPRRRVCEVADSRIKFYIDLVYYGSNDSATGTIENQIAQRQGQKDRIHRIELSSLNQYSSGQILFQCNLLDQAGIYQVQLNSIYEPDEPVALSNPMILVWSPFYKLDIRTPSIFPCNNYLTVIYRHPPCIGEEDKVRLYKVIRLTQSSIASPTNLRYIGEQRVRIGASTVNFACNMFHDTSLGYCFKYVSRAANGAVAEQTSLCVPANPQTEVVDGGWSEWTEWSECSTTCGSGTRTRYRACDKPSPTWGGQYCQGDSLQSARCNINCAVGPTIAGVAGLTPPPSCQCGCQMSLSAGDTGHIVGAVHMCLGSSIWVLRVPQGYVIHLTFQAFTIDVDNRQTWLKVRDGDSHRSDLLLHRSGGPLPEPVKTSLNSMLIELMSPYQKSDLYQIANEGFVATYSVSAGNGTVVMLNPKPHADNKGWVSTVTLIGIGVCALVLVLILVFLIHHRRMTKEDAHKQSQMGGEALLVNGEAPNSPSHSSHSLQGSQNISFADPASPTRSPTKRAYVLARSLPNSPDHPTRGVAGYKSPTDPSHPPVPGSPRKAVGVPGPRSPQDLPSPYFMNAKPSDYIHDEGALKPGKHARHKGNRRSGASPDRQRHSGSMSPMQLSQPSSPRTRQKPREGSVPLADMEDLSPSSPSTTALPQLPPAHRHRATEDIPLNSYGASYPRHQHGVADTYIDTSPRTGPRPPVEGRDSRHYNDNVGKGKSGNKLRPKSSSMSTGECTPTTPDRQNANYISSSDSSRTKPDLKPLPLRHVQRPDGQSPDNRMEDPNANRSPSTASHELSPVLQHTKLFPESSSQTPSDIASQQDEFEYDDYIPHLPGSYFSMDPGAYTLTWSQQPSWATGKLPSSTRSKTQTTDNDITPSGESHA